MKKKTWFKCFLLPRKTKTRIILVHYIYKQSSKNHSSYIPTVWRLRVNSKPMMSQAESVMELWQLQFHIVHSRYNVHILMQIEVRTVKWLTMDGPDQFPRYSSTTLWVTECVFILCMTWHCFLIVSSIWVLGNTVNTVHSRGDNVQLNWPKLLTSTFTTSNIGQMGCGVPRAWTSGCGKPPQKPDWALS